MCNIASFMIARSKRTLAGRLQDYPQDNPPGTIHPPIIHSGILDSLRNRSRDQINDLYYHRVPVPFWDRHLGPRPAAAPPPQTVTQTPPPPATFDFCLRLIGSALVRTSLGGLPPPPQPCTCQLAFVSHSFPIAFLSCRSSPHFLRCSPVIISRTKHGLSSVFRKRKQETQTRKEPAEGFEPGNPVLLHGWNVGVS